MKDLARTILADVPVGKEFVLHIGKTRKLRNIIDLRFELEKMGEDEYNHHVTKERNDFAVWVEDTIGDKQLAEDFRNAKSKASVGSILKSRIDFAINVIERENKKIISDEIERVKNIGNKKSTKIDDQIEYLEKDIKKIKDNIDIEEKIINKIDIPAEPHPINAQLVQFVFGLIVGIVLGIILVKTFL